MSSNSPPLGWKPVMPSNGWAVAFWTPRRSSHKIIFHLVATFLQTICIIKPASFAPGYLSKKAFFVAIPHGLNLTPDTSWEQHEQPPRIQKIFWNGKPNGTHWQLWMCILSSILVSTGFTMVNPPRESSKVMRLGTEGLGHHGICLSPNVSWRYLTVDFGMFLSTKIIWRCLTADKIFFYQKAIRRYLTVGPSWMNSFEGPRGTKPTLSDAIWRALPDPKILIDIRRYPTRPPPPTPNHKSRYPTLSHAHPTPKKHLDRGNKRYFFNHATFLENGWTLYPPDSVR